MKMLSEPEIKNMLSRLYWDVDGINDGMEDKNKNGIVDHGETDPCKADTDGDGINDLTDQLPTNPKEWLDTDKDGIGNNSDSDDDNDGMPDSWEQLYGLNSLVDDSLLDKDKDGVSNIREYKCDTDPTNPESFPAAATPWIPLLLDAK